MTPEAHLKKWADDKAAQTAAWLKEFEAIGPDEVRLHLDNGGYPQGHPRRALALRWLKDHSASPLGSAP